MKRQKLKQYRKFNCFSGRQISGNLLKFVAVKEYTTKKIIVVRESNLSKSFLVGN